MQSTLPTRTLLFVLALTACLGLGTGCRISRNLALPHSPGEPGVLRTVPSMKVALQVMDERPAAERDLVAKVAKVDYVVEGGVVPNLESALKAEFEKAGHQVVPPGAEGAAWVIKVGVQRFWAGVKQVGGGTAIEKYAEINAEVRVGPAGDAKPATAFPVSVRQSRVYPLAAPGGFAEVMGPAYEEFIRNLTMDPQLITALKGAR